MIFFRNIFVYHTPSNFNTNILGKGMCTTRKLSRRDFDRRKIE